MAEFTSTVMVPENVHEVLGMNIASVGLVPFLFSITLWTFILVFFMVSCSVSVAGCQHSRSTLGHSSSIGLNIIFTCLRMSH